MIYTSNIKGLDVNIIKVESDIDRKSVLRGIDIVGMADTAVKESEKRVKGALRNHGFDFLKGRITVNLSPADLKKSGSHFDLPIALAILLSTGDLKEKDVFAMGELSLKGEIRPSRGVLPSLMKLKEEGFNGIVVVPKDNYEEAAIIGFKNTYALESLREVLELVNDVTIFEEVQKKEVACSFDFDVDMEEVKGQEVAKRALEIAAAGFHNVLMVGPPGSGKTMLARRLPTILPPMSFGEILETTKIYSVAGLLHDGIINKRPFRSPHHTASPVAIVGGGSDARPGEISLAHNGVLFMDELPEFRRDVLEALREPLEERKVTVSRAKTTAVYPANFIFVGAMNPCSCTEIDENGECICSDYEKIKYSRKISGPILDRIDIHIRVKRMKFKEFVSDKKGEKSEKIRKRVVAAREIQLKRGKLNSQLSKKEIEEYIRLDSSSLTLLERFSDKYNLSGRAIDKILRVARTIADLDGRADVKKEDILEAIQYRVVLS